MLIQNTTLYIEESILMDCIDKLKMGYISKLQSHQKFNNIIFTEVLTNNEPNIRTYSIQVFCSSIDELKIWKNNFQPKLESISASYSGKMLFFHSKMRIID